MITIRFSTRKNPVSALIRYVTMSKFSHVCFILPDGRLLGAEIIGGVQIRDDHGKDSRVAIRYVDAPDTVLDRAVEKIGTKYDWRYLFGWLFRKTWEDDSRLSCNELVFSCIKEEGVSLLNIEELDSLSPRDLLISPLMLKDKEEECVG